jgi:hypothetical protein
MDSTVAFEPTAKRTRRSGVRAKSGQTGMTMSKLLRGAVAGAGAWKLGGGFIGTVLLFILLWVVLGYFDIFK